MRALRGALAGLGPPGDEFELFFVLSLENQRLFRTTGTYPLMLMEARKKRLITRTSVSKTPAA